MKRVLVTMLCFFIVSAHASVTAAHNAIGSGKRIMKEYYREDTPECIFCLVQYTFELTGGGMTGWTRVDNTAQPGVFFHVDDFAGIAPGDFGGLVPMEGAQSMWCGSRPDDSSPYLCSWSNAPGYGNGWNQMLQSDPIPFVGAVTLDFKAHYDSEPDYDFTLVEYDAGEYAWTEIARFSGTGDTIASFVIPLTTANTKLRFRFMSNDAWSDQDGVRNSDGAFIVDSISVRDDGLTYSNYQNFESGNVGDTQAGIWTASAQVGFGTYSGLRTGLSDKDPCGSNFTNQIAFFLGSPYPSTSYPGLYDTPFCTSLGGASSLCQNDMFVSPVIDINKYSTTCNHVQNAAIDSGTQPWYGGYDLSFSVYRDLPLQNLVFYTWHVRNISSSGCPGPWLDRGLVYYGSDMDLFYIVNNVSDLIIGPNVQIAVGVVDMCSVWQNGFGDCSAHTTAPWFDNIKLCRCQVRGPNWNFRDIDLFQDNFPSDGDDIESWVRADAANDINPPDNPSILPADAVVINCAAPFGQTLAIDDGWPAIYMHVKCSYIGPAPDKPSLFGSSLEGDHGRYRGDDGVWTIIQGDSARTGPPRSAVIRDAYMFDLNDSLLTRGYKIEYYFTATSIADETSRLPGFPMDWSNSLAFEFTCLPTLKSDVLFVDNFVGPTLDSDVLMDDGSPGYDSWKGFADDYWMPTFKAIFPPPNDIPDKYDVNGASSLVSSGLAGRAHLEHLKAAYNIIIWESGDLERGTITDGTVKSGKGDDCTLLIDWMNTSLHPCGLWICGDNIAHDLAVNCGTTNAMALLNNWCGVNYIMDSYFGLTGKVSPLLAGNWAGIFFPGGVPYRFSAFGGCPIINRFDVLGVAGTGVPAINYPDYTGLGYYAGIQNESTNLYGQPVRTMWFGFSFQYIRDDSLYAPIDRNTVAARVIEWMEGTILPDVSGGVVPGINSVAQNYPNPFNPSTIIKYEIKRKGPVTVKVYDVNGALVRTLVDGIKDGGSYTVIWDGRNNRGASVASGIYLYRMETTGFSKTKKTVLLR